MMNKFITVAMNENRISRRIFFTSAAIGAAGAAAFFTPGVFAEQLTQTPRQTEGPFYPEDAARHPTNDLLIINDTVTACWEQVRGWVVIQQRPLRHGG